MLSAHVNDSCAMYWNTKNNLIEMLPAIFKDKEHRFTFLVLKIGKCPLNPAGIE